jgi:hypothetical protein
MEFGFTKEQQAFREEVREFLEAERKAGTFQTRPHNSIGNHSRELSKKMAQKGWIGMTWPKEYGGQGKTYVDRTILMEEALKYQAPLGAHFLGDRQIGPCIIHFGTEEQKREWLPKILNADVSFCLLFSEPDAGSDLVAVRSTAIEEGDFFTLNGQKVWTSGGHLADHGWLLAKTDPRAPQPHKGTSEFILDMKLPGVTVRPLINMAGEHSFNEVFFDNVKVPKNCMVGEKNKGFYQIMAQMGFERAGIERLMQNYTIFEYLKEYVRSTKRNGKVLFEDPLIRSTVAQLEIEFNAGRLLCYMVAWTVDQGKMPDYEAALCKAFCTQFEQRITDSLTRIVGPQSTLMPGSKHALFAGEVARNYLWLPSYTLQGGSTEILKNIVARRGLKMA